MIEDPSTLIHTVRISLDHLRFGMHRGYGSIGGLNRWSRHSILSRSQMGKSSVNGEFPARIWVDYRRLPEGTGGENYTIWWGEKKHKKNSPYPQCWFLVHIQNSPKLIKPHDPSLKSMRAQRLWSAEPEASGTVPAMAAIGSLDGLPMINVPQGMPTMSFN